MAHIYKRGKTWTVRFSKRQKIFNPDTNEYESVLKQKSKGGFRTKAEAQKYGIEMESQSINGIKVVDNPMFIDYYKNWYKTVKSVNKKKTSLKTMKSKSNEIIRYFSTVKIKDIDSFMYQNFINSIAKDHSLNYVSQIHGLVKSCITYAVNDGLLTRNFTSNAKIHGNNDHNLKVEYLNAKEMKKLSKYCIDLLNSGYKDSYAPYTILVALQTGMRAGEILALTWNDIDFKNNTININKTWDSVSKEIHSPKTKSSVRKIPVNQETIDLITRLKSDKHHYVFEKDNGLPPRIQSLNRFLKRSLRNLGILKEGYHFHSLRHSHVAYLLSKGIDVYAISQRLGHADLSITLKTYAYILEETKEKEDKLINKSLKKLF